MTNEERVKEKRTEHLHLYLLGLYY